jgi:hypothetical protein
MLHKHVQESSTRQADATLPFHPLTLTLNTLMAASNSLLARNLEAYMQEVSRRG